MNYVLELHLLVVIVDMKKTKTVAGECISVKMILLMNVVDLDIDTYHKNTKY